MNNHFAFWASPAACAAIPTPAPLCAPPPSSCQKVPHRHLRTRTHSAFNEDEERKPPAKVVELKRRIREADAILIVTPEYTTPSPASLRTRSTWASRPYGDSTWNGKPAAIMGASIGAIGDARAQYHLRQMMVFLNMFPVNQPEVMLGNATTRFDSQGNLTDGTTKELIRQLLHNLVEWAQRIGEAPRA
jgi:chromate reductase